MTVDLIDVDYSETATGAETNVVVEPARTAVSTPTSERQADLPFSVSRRQLYYWTTRWQEDERAAMEELARGKGREFTSASDAFRWLLDPEDD